MKRPLFVIGATFSLTTWLAFLFNFKYSIIVALIFGVFGTLVLLARRQNARVFVLVLLSISGAFLNFSIYAIRTATPFETMSGKIVEIKGIVTATSMMGRSASYTVTANFPNAPNLPHGANIIVRDYSGQYCEVGEVISCSIKLSLPSETGAEGYYRSSGVVALGNINGIITKEDLAGYRLQKLVFSFRSFLYRNLNLHLTSQNAAISGAMILGVKGDIPPDVYRDVSRAGTAHILSISGLHLSIITSLFLKLFKKLTIPDRLSYFFTIIIWFMLAFFVGFTASLTRAVVMTVVMMFGRIIYKKSDSITSLGLAILAISIFRPFWVVGIGFWLSGASTLGIIVLSPRFSAYFIGKLGNGQHKLHKISTSLIETATVSLSAYLFTLPIMIFAGSGISLLSPLANVLISPFILPVMIGSFACSIVSSDMIIIKIIAVVTDFSINLILNISRFISRLPFAVLPIDEGYTLIIIVLVVVFCAILITKRVDKKLVFYGALLVVICYCAGNISLGFVNKDRFELATIEGVGTAVIIKDSRAVLIGVPTRYTVSRLMKYLNYRGVASISAVIAPDCPDQIDSGLLRIDSVYGIETMIGPDDGYILSQLELALPNSTVLSCGYADIDIAGVAKVKVSQDGDRIGIATGEDYFILKTTAEYPTTEQYNLADITIFDKGVIRLPPGKLPLFEPLGQYLYGERRVALKYIG